jgi:AcrR family transcriptional regulator
MAISKTTRNREATEQRLIDACERILLSRGPEGIGVNNVVQEAGVGKQLLYRYFDGLPGLLAAWLERGANWPGAEELVGSRASFDKLNYKEKVKRIQRNYLKALRKRPVIVRLMASEMMNPSDVTSALESASDTVGRELAGILSELESDSQQDLVDLSFIFYCMLNYLAMRSVTSPHCFGMDLQQPDSWGRVEAVIDRLVDSYLD